MNRKIACLCALVLTFVGIRTSRGQDAGTSLPGSLQDPGISSSWSGSPTDFQIPASSPASNDGFLPPLALSDYMLNSQPGCCGPVGNCFGPLMMELYGRAGVSVAVGGGLFSRALAPGWLVQGGGRTMFFNPQGTAAWTADVGLSNIAYLGDNWNVVAPLHNIIAKLPTPIPGGPTNAIVPTVPVTIRSLNLTFATLGFGREWFLLGQAFPCGDQNGPRGCNWRVGIDAGGRYGTSKLEMHELQHRTDTIGGPYVALHTDLEIPYGCCVFQVGFRGEWDYIWSDILQTQNNADIQNLNILITAGVRF